MTRLLDTVPEADLEAWLSKMPQDEQDHMRPLYAVPPRFLPVVLGALVEEKMGDMLAARLIDDPKTVRYAKGLGYKQKAELCFMLGLFHAEFLDALMGLATVRNHFAHEPSPKYTDRKSADALKNLWTLQVNGITRGKGESETDIKFTIKKGHDDIESDEAKGRLILMNLYQFLRAILYDSASKSTRVDLVWVKGRYVTVEKPR